jgi:polyisoprenoid-binding protein YceI
MKKMILAGVMALASVSFGSSWEIDTSHASANFAAKHLMISTVNGSLGDVTGKVNVDDKDFTKSTFEASIDVKGISTKNGKRDDHLKAKDFFEADKFAAITFKSTKIEKVSDTKFKITGDLKIKDKSKSIVLDAEITPEVVNPMSKMVTKGLAATGVVNRKDFGLGSDMPGAMISEDIKIMIDGEFVKKDGAAAAPAAPAKKEEMKKEEPKKDGKK